jgi:adenylylsulfate kinase
VWLTGLPSSGKSTLSRAVVAALRARGRPTCLLDGDEVRKVLVPAPGYDEQSRDHFYATLAGLAALLARQGQVAVVAATAHRRDYRERARQQAPAFVEVYVEASREEVEARDSKGLYEKSRAGELRELPGIDLAYETPEAPEVVSHGGRDGAAVTRIVAAVAGVLADA